MSLLPARAVEGLKICIITLKEKGFIINFYFFNTTKVS